MTNKHNDAEPLIEAVLADIEAQQAESEKTTMVEMVGWVVIGLAFAALVHFM